MMRIALALAALLALGAFLPVADATIDACTGVATQIAPPVALLLKVSGPLAYMDGSCNGTGVVGGTWPGLPQCVSPGVHVVGSTYCGPLVAGGANVVCTWVGSSGRVDTLTVGFDLDGDGHIFDNRDPAERLPSHPPRIELSALDRTLGNDLVPILGSGTYRLTAPADARVIAYPTTTGNAQASGAAYVGCA